MDLFSGIGGSSLGAVNAGVEIVAAFDMWNLAGKTYRLNFPNAKFFRGRLEKRNLKKLKSEVGRIDLILASPECTSHSPAKGNKLPCEASKNTAFQVLRFARAFRPRWIVIENVVSMRNWTRYSELKSKLEREGYHVREQVLNASDFGVAQSRRRLFLLCDRSRLPKVIPALAGDRQPAQTCIELVDTYKYAPLYKKGRAKPTLSRARRALRALGNATPFLLVYYGSDAAGGWQRLDQPLRTITTIDRFALVRPQGTRGRGMRMLQVPELQRAMGMKDLQLSYGSRRERIKMLGNGVCAPVMEAVIAGLTAETQDG